MLTQQTKGSKLAEMMQKAYSTCVGTYKLLRTALTKSCPN